LLKKLGQQNVSPPDGKAVIESSPKFTVAVESHHRRIRADERTRLLASIRESRFAWLVADWGIGKDEFLATCIEVLRAEVPHLMPSS
jgi:hypothetical protein